MDNEVIDTAFSDVTLQVLDKNGNVEAAQYMELDLRKMVVDLKDDPDALVKIIEHYIEYKEYSSISIVLALDVNNLTWHVFEGIVNPRTHTFKVVRPITTFEANARDVYRPPTVAVNFVASAAVARKVSVWIP